MTRKRPTRAEQKARKAERHEIVRSIMQEPDDVVFFPVALGRIAMSAAVWGSVALGVLALGVLASAVFLMRDEIAGLGKQLQQKDVDLVILSSELQKVRDQMFGEQIVEKQGKITLRLIDADTGVARAVSNVALKDTPYPLGPEESRVVNGKYLYWMDEEGILRVNLEDGTSYRIVIKPFISSVAVSKDGSWLAYAYSEGLRDPGSVGLNERAVAMPLSGRGDPIELGELAGITPGNIPAVYGFSEDIKELLWSVFVGDAEGRSTLHRIRIANGQVGGSFDLQSRPGTIGFSPDGSIAALFEGSQNDAGGFDVKRLVFVDAAGKRTVRYNFPLGSLVSLQTAWSTDGSSLVVNVSDEYLAFPIKGTAAPTNLGKAGVSIFEAASEVAYLPERFLLVVQPGLAGTYAYRNLATDAISSGDGPFSDIAGWSSDLNAVVLLENTHE